MRRRSLGSLGRCDVSKVLVRGRHACRRNSLWLRNNVLSSYTLQQGAQRPVHGMRPLEGVTDLCSLKLRCHAPSFT